MANERPVTPEMVRELARLRGVDLTRVNIETIAVRLSELARDMDRLRDELPGETAPAPMWPSR